MRLALISYEFPPKTLGGIATYAKHTISMLLARGHSVTVFAGSPDSTAAVEENFRGARVRRLPCSDRLQFASVAVPALAAEHAAEPFDLAEISDLYAEGAGLRNAIPSLPTVLRAHTPSFIPHEIDFHAVSAPVRVLRAARRLCGALTHREPWRPALRSAVDRVFFRRYFNLMTDRERQPALEADLVAPPSRRLADRLVRDWRIPSRKIRVVPYPHLPAPDLLALHAPTDARTIGFHGGIRLFKGVHVLAEAMQRIVTKHPQMRLVLAGTSGASPVRQLSLAAWRRDRMVEWRDTLDWLAPRFTALGGRVLIRGFVAPEHLSTHLAEADICVFPSLFDNFPSACLEAMSAARPIVATRSGGMEEMLGDDEAGLLVPPGDAAALAEAICRLIEDSELRLRLACAARERVLASYSPEVIGPRMEALYREAIQLRENASANHPETRSVD